MVELDQQSIEDANKALRVMAENFEVYDPEFPSLSQAEFGHIASLFYGKETEAMESEQKERVKKALALLNCVSYFGNGKGYHRKFDGYEEPEKCTCCTLANNCDFQNGNIDPFVHLNYEAPLNNSSNNNISYLEFIVKIPSQTPNLIENTNDSSEQNNIEKPLMRKPRFLTVEQTEMLRHEIADLVNKGMSLRKSCAVVRRKYEIKYTIDGLKTAFKDLI